MENEQINKKILELWKSNITPDEVKEIYPLLYPEFEKKCDILFIGFNPSFSEKSMRKIRANLKDTILEGKDLSEILKLKPGDHPEYVIEVERVAKKRVEYFYKMQELSKELNAEWEHIDLFLFRNTVQKEAKMWIYQSKHELNAFANAQLAIVKEILEIIKPGLIVVVNAQSSDIINHVFKIDRTIFNEKGYDLLEEYGIPIIFGSMLHGQRALDKYSFRTLKRSIQKCLEENSKT